MSDSIEGMEQRVQSEKRGHKIMKRVAILAVVGALVVVAAMRLAAVHSRNTSLTDDITVDRVAVTVAEVTQKSSSVTLNLTGTTSPLQELDIAAETEGKITHLHFELGQTVERGSVLATIDDKITALDYSTAKLAADRLDKDFARIKQLYERNLASQQEYDNAVASYETAVNTLQEAEKRLSYTRVIAPISGVVAERYVEEGAYVTPGTPIASVVNISSLKVQINVSETDVYQLTVGMPVTVLTDIYPGVRFKGTITFVSPHGDASHNYPVEIEMANSTDHPLKSGTFVTALVTRTDLSEGLYIPREALQGSVKDAQVYVVEDDTARLRQLVLGGDNNGDLEVLSGLTAQDRVVVSGQVNLTDNRAVTILRNE